MMRKTESKLFSFLCPSCQKRAPTFSKTGYRWECRHRDVAVIEQGGDRRVTFEGHDDRAKTWPDFDNTGRFFTRDVI